MLWILYIHIPLELIHFTSRAHKFKRIHLLNMPQMFNNLRNFYWRTVKWLSILHPLTGYFIWAYRNYFRFNNVPKVLYTYFQKVRIITDPSLQTVRIDPLSDLIPLLSGMFAKHKSYRHLLSSIWRIKVHVRKGIFRGWTSFLIIHEVN